MSRVHFRKSLFSYLLLHNPSNLTTADLVLLLKAKFEESKHFKTQGQPHEHPGRGQHVNMQI